MSSAVSGWFKGFKAPKSQSPQSHTSSPSHSPLFDAGVTQEEPSVNHLLANSSPVTQVKSQSQSLKPKIDPQNISSPNTLMSFVCGYGNSFKTRLNNIKLNATMSFLSLIDSAKESMSSASNACISTSKKFGQKVQEICQSVHDSVALAYTRFYYNVSFECTSKNMTKRILSEIAMIVIKVICTALLAAIIAVILENPIGMAVLIAVISALSIGILSSIIKWAFTTYFAEKLVKYGVGQEAVAEIQKDLLRNDGDVKKLDHKKLLLNLVASPLQFLEYLKNEYIYSILLEKEKQGKITKSEKTYLEEIKKTMFGCIEIEFIDDADDEILLQKKANGYYILKDTLYFFTDGKKILITLSNDIKDLYKINSSKIYKEQKFLSLQENTSQNKKIKLTQSDFVKAFLIPEYAKQIEKIQLISSNPKEEAKIFEHIKSYMTPAPTRATESEDSASKRTYVSICYNFVDTNIKKIDKTELKDGFIICKEEQKDGTYQLILALAHRQEILKIKNLSKTEEPKQASLRPYIEQDFSFLTQDLTGQLYTNTHNYIVDDQEKNRQEIIEIIKQIKINDLYKDEKGKTITVEAFSIGHFEEIFELWGVLEETHITQKIVEATKKPQHQTFKEIVEKLPESMQLRLTKEEKSFVQTTEEITEKLNRRRNILKEPIQKEEELSFLADAEKRGELSFKCGEKNFLLNIDLILEQKPNTEDDVALFIENNQFFNDRLIFKREKFKNFTGFVAYPRKNASEEIEHWMMYVEDSKPYETILKKLDKEKLLCRIIENSCLPKKDNIKEMIDISEYLETGTSLDTKKQNNRFFTKIELNNIFYTEEIDLNLIVGDNASRQFDHEELKAYIQKNEKFTAFNGSIIYKNKNGQYMFVSMQDKHLFLEFEIALDQEKFSPKNIKTLLDSLLSIKNKTCPMEQFIKKEDFYEKQKEKIRKLFKEFMTPINDQKQEKTSHINYIDDYTSAYKNSIGKTKIRYFTALTSHAAAESLKETNFFGSHSSYSSDPEWNVSDVEAEGIVAFLASAFIQSLLIRGVHTLWMDADIPALKKMANYLKRETGGFVIVLLFFTSGFAMNLMSNYIPSFQEILEELPAAATESALGGVEGVFGLNIITVFALMVYRTILMKSYTAADEKLSDLYLTNQETTSINDLGRHVRRCIPYHILRKENLLKELQDKANALNTAIDNGEKDNCIEEAFLELESLNQEFRSFVESIEKLQKVVSLYTDKISITPQQRSTIDLLKSLPFYDIISV